MRREGFIPPSESRVWARLISAKRGEAIEKPHRRRRKILAENQSPEAALLYSSFILFV